MKIFRRRLITGAGSAMLVSVGGFLETPQSGATEDRSLAPACCPVVELRQYTLFPDKRDVLIDLFEREFIESQEATGIRVIGQFRDLDNPNRFVWLRGFQDMESRAQMLGAFYDGPVWKAHREAANATIADSDNVLLLRPADTGSGFRLQEDRPLAGTNATPRGLVIATIYYFGAPPSDDFVKFFTHEMRPALTKSGAPVFASFVTESATNTFPRLPVRQGENVFVWFSSFPDRAAYEHHRAALDRSERWQAISEDLVYRLKGRPEILRLAPTTRSQLHG